VEIETCGSGFDTYLWLTETDGTIVTFNDDSCGLSSRITSTLDAGEYVVVVDGFSSSTGQYTLDITCNTGPSPSPAPCTQNPPEFISCGHVISGSTSGSCDSYGNSAGDVRYTLSLIDDSTDVTISTCDGTSYDSYLWLLDSSGFQWDSNDDSCGLASSITTSLPAGEYTIVVDGFSSHEGSYDLSVSCELQNEGSGSQEVGGPLCVAFRSLSRVFGLGSVFSDRFACTFDE